MLIRSCSQALDHKRSISSSSKLPPILRDEICIRRASPTLIIASRDSGAVDFSLYLLSDSTLVTHLSPKRRLGRRRVDLCADGLRKRAYHFLRNAAAIFSIIHRSPTQISHNAIRKPMTSSRKPMSFQKDLPPPGIYDGACAIVKRNPSPCIWKPCV
jgi:hypothetical protein